MHEDLLNILSDSNKDIDNQKIMDYISGRLSSEQKHEVEKWMIDNPFFNEAVEGLQHADAKRFQRMLMRSMPHCANTLNTGK
jgi:anti-sigma factor RsiW